MDFIEIGGNLLDDMYKGVYRGKERHPADLDDVLQRALNPPNDASYRVHKIVVSAGSLSESREALELARSKDGLYSTVGVHPTRCNELMDESSPGQVSDDLINSLIRICQDGMTDGTVRAIGELGLDYARTQFCSVDVQKAGFLAQLRVAEVTKLPLFLHNRDTGTDLLDLLKENRQRFTKGVVHSFDDTAELARAFLDLDLYIGVNGCSLKTDDNLEVVKGLPLDRLLLETDCPWCDIRASHAGFEYVKTKYPTKQEKKYEKGCCVKGRNEPCHIIQVAEVVAGVKGLSVEEVAAACYRNSMDFFSFE
uniref:TatD related DNase n=1 Tax=Leptocylindrus danicus TaxID=163516 RepID=A0A7S2KCX0_9STRA|mmetsp:Transcript_20590/g.30633  ORF Transcript_20590/g.30633 Transcript_20590/m.30633 type:complete len:309 (+) Transcript_20590:416-1342(+)